MIKEEYLHDFDQSTQIRPIREVFKPNYGVTYAEPADTSRALGSIKLEGLTVQEHPEYKSRMTRAELEHIQASEKATYINS